MKLNCFKNVPKYMKVYLKVAFDFQIFDPKLLQIPDEMKFRMFETDMNIKKDTMKKQFNLALPISIAFLNSRTNK